MQQARRVYTVKEYFEIEEASEEKHEFYDGEIVALAGASFNHNRIVLNLSYALMAALRDSSCEVLAADMRVRLRQGAYTYPDVVVLCGEVRLTPDPLDTAAEPTVVIEVLSRSTQNYDRGMKSRLYRSIASLTDYVLVEQDQVHVEHLSRAGNGEWLLREHDDLAEVLKLASIGVEIPLSEIYRRVRFETPGAAMPVE